MGDGGITPRVSRRVATARCYVHVVKPLSGYRIESDAGEQLRFSDAQFLVKVPAEATGGSFAILEEIDPLDTPLHVHSNEDEWWYILEGDHMIRIGDEELEAGPGDIVFGPRGVPHAQRRVVPRTGRFFVFFSPGNFEGFFRELSEAERTGSSMPEAYVSISEKYGITWLDE